MYNVIYTYESCQPKSKGELRHMNLGQFDSEAAARDYILDQYDDLVARFDDDGEGDMPTHIIAEVISKKYSIEAV